MTPASILMLLLTLAASSAAPSFLRGADEDKVGSFLASYPPDICYNPTKEYAECKICADGKRGGAPEYFCVDGQCVDCYDEVNYENMRYCVAAGCIDPGPNPCGEPGSNCKGCNAGKECVNGACLDCNAQQNYKACAAAGCG